MRISLFSKGFAHFSIHGHHQWVTNWLDKHKEMKFFREAIHEKVLGEMEKMTGKAGAHNIMGYFLNFRVTLKIIITTENKNNYWVFFD